MRISSLVLAVTLPAIAAPLPAIHVDAAEGRAVATCQGQRATIVGPNRTEGRIVGTDRRDVVVTARATDVRTFGGDDLVCVQGAGAGARVRVRTAGGADRVIVAAGVRRHVDLELGNGDDLLRLPGGNRGTVSVRGNDGRDRLSIGNGVGRRSLTVDAARGRATRGGVAWLRLRGLESYLLPSPSGATTTFRGSGRGESLTLAPTYATGTTPAAVVDMAGGDDWVSFRTDGRPRRIGGGPGRDVAHVLSYGHAGPDGLPQIPTDAALSVSASHYADREGGTRTELDSLEDYRIISTGPVDFIGTDTGERVVVSTCGYLSMVRGRGGDDLLAEVAFPTTSFTAPGCTGPGVDGPINLRGEEGDDLLVGSTYDDLLEGGPGTDRIVGLGGTDLCTDGETVLSCEGE